MTVDGILGVGATIGTAFVVVISAARAVRASRDGRRADAKRATVSAVGTLPLLLICVFLLTHLL